MNKAFLYGRLTKDPDVRTTQSGVSVANFTVACDRSFKNADGTKTTDFIPCVAWKGQADLLGNYFSKGDRIVVVGTIQPRSWEDEKGQKRYTTEVVVSDIDFVETKREREQSQGYTASDSYAPPPAEDNNYPPLPFEMN